MPINFDIKKFKKDSSVYIETGFFKGGSASKALESGFTKIHSCDINESFLEEGRKNFSNEITEGKLNLHFGRSTDVLKTILSSLQEKAVFFLDAHDITYENTDQKLWEDKDNCPILDELEIIQSHGIKDHTIIIDDIRMFDYGCTPGTWAFDRNIKISNLLKKLKEINNNYKIVVENGICDKDVIVAYIE